MAAESGSCKRKSEECFSPKAHAFSVDSLLSGEGDPFMAVGGRAKDSTANPGGHGLGAQEREVTLPADLQYDFTESILPGL